MQDPTNSTDNWNPCPRGALSGLNAPASRSSVTPFRAGLIAGVAACLLFASFAALMSRSNGDVESVQGITCGDVMPRLAEFKAGKLETQLHNRIEAHLAMCGRCRAACDNLALRVRDETVLPQMLAAIR